MNRNTERLVQWYLDHMVPYPWRATRDPYRIWLSEILLQQTRVTVVLRYYEKMLQQFPTLCSLAESSYADFARVWSGIGYYTRARNMHACAREIQAKHGGAFPRDFNALKSLPGFGPYTAGALRNLLYNELTPAVDANIARVLGRLTANEFPRNSRSFREDVERSFLEYGKGAPASEYFQSLMELGERVCLPKPRCTECPLSRACKAFAQGITERIPVRVARPTTRTFHWYFLLIRRNDKFYMTRNSGRDFLKDAWLFPDILSEAVLSSRQLRRRFAETWSISAAGLRETGTVRHAVTFRRITCHALIGNKASFSTSRGTWVAADAIHELHTSSVAHKILSLM